MKANVHNTLKGWREHFLVLDLTGTSKLNHLHIVDSLDGIYYLVELCDLCPLGQVERKIQRSTKIKTCKDKMEPQQQISMRSTAVS